MMMMARRRAAEKEGGRKGKEEVKRNIERLKNELEEKKGSRELGKTVGRA